MKKIILLLILINSFGIIPSSCSDGVIRKVKENFPNGKEKLVVYMRDTILVKKEEFYQNGKRKSLDEYTDSLVVYSVWNPEGHLLETSSLIGAEDGENGTVIRYENNLKVLEVTYEGGGISELTNFYPNGNKMKHSKGGEITNLDVTTEWYESGKKKSFKDQYGKKETFYENGDKESLTYLGKEEKDTLTQYWWNESGELIKEEFWEKGRLIETKEY